MDRSQASGGGERRRLLCRRSNTSVVYFLSKCNERLGEGTSTTTTLEGSAIPLSSFFLFFSSSFHFSVTTTRASLSLSLCEGFDYLLSSYQS